MKRHHPFHTLLILLLGLCVFAAGSVNHSDGSGAPVSEMDEGFEEVMEDLAEEDLPAGTDMIAFECCTHDIDSPREATPPLARGCRLSPAHCSFGWVLPLRI